MSKSTKRMMDMIPESAIQVLHRGAVVRGGGGGVTRRSKARRGGLKGKGQAIKFCKVLGIVAVYSTYMRALTSKKFCQEFSDGK